MSFFSYTTPFLMTFRLEMWFSCSRHDRVFIETVEFNSLFIVRQESKWKFKRKPQKTLWKENVNENMVTKKKPGVKSFPFRKEK